jgi:hypothetical protein
LKPGAYNAPVSEEFNSHPDALHIVVDQVVVANLNRILTFVLSTLMPTTHSIHDFPAVQGGLMPYRPSYVGLFGAPVIMSLGF